MTQPTALQILDMVISELEKHNLTDVGTFALPKIQKENEYEEYSFNYQYLDSSFVFRELEIEAQDPQQTHSALGKLLAASREYFELAQRIPERFERELSKLTTEPAPEIILETIDEKQVNLGERLNRVEVLELIRLIEFIEKNLSEEIDDAFLNNLNF